MTLEKALKSVKASSSKLLLRIGAYTLSYQDGKFFDTKGRNVQLTEKEINSNEWEIKNTYR